MTGWRSGGALVPAGCLAVVTVLAADSASAAERAVPSRTLFSFADEDVFESSGLVDRGRIVFTNNDSGDDAVVYGIDAANGRTVSETTYADEVDDVEALAPGRDGSLWAGDIGDNKEDRDDISVYRLPPLADRDDRAAAEADSTVEDHVAAERFRLTYPDGPHNAETLLVHPVSGRVFVVTKSALGGTVYAAPRRLSADEANRLRPFATVSGLLTDGAFLPDGRHVVLRTYRTASVYTFPGFGLVGTVRLPEQRQGEGLSVSPRGRVLVSSEGVHAPVLQVRLPPGLTRGAGSPGTSVGTAPSTRPASPAVSERPRRDAAQWAWIALAAGGVAGVGYLTVRASRLRGPRRR